MRGIHFFPKVWGMPRAGDFFLRKGWRKMALCIPRFVQTFAKQALIKLSVGGHLLVKVSIQDGDSLTHVYTSYLVKRAALTEYR